ncbi:MAG: alcohol dehydrogenase catalytic domain-containing protein [Candidatus Hydrogenedentales bacterium]|jgi:threonine dehydrogenase-like Zn-dependent dehydrogenase
MRAVVFDGEPRLVDLPAPEPGPGEALIRTLVTGICNTDLEILKGYMGYRGVIGHEFVGVVERAANTHLIGKRVVGEINCVCRRCRYCQSELSHHCPNRTVLGIQNRNGTLAEYFVLPEENLYMVAEGMPDEVAVFTEPTAAAFRIDEQLDITQNDRVIVLGDGKLAQLVAQVIALRTKKLTCIGKHAWKLDMLRKLQIPVATATDPVEPGADIVVEATGSPEGLARAMELVRPEGTIVLKTTAANPTRMNFSVPVINEISIIGSRCGPFRPALEALMLGTVEVRSLVTERYPLAEALHALERAAAPDVMKVLVHA